MDVMDVICKHCGATNKKEKYQYTVTCTKCRKTTTYMVQPRRPESTPQG